MQKFAVLHINMFVQEPAMKGAAALLAMGSILRVYVLKNTIGKTEAVNNVTAAIIYLAMRLVIRGARPVAEAIMRVVPVPTAIAKIAAATARKRHV